MKNNTMRACFFLLSFIPAVVFAGSGITTPNPKLYSDAVLADIANTATSKGAVSRTAFDKPSKSLSVSDFGVVGNGVTDDTVAIQAAFVNTRAKGGVSKKLYFPKGTYLITKSITCGSNQVVEFDPGVVINFVPPAPIQNYALFGAAHQVNVVFSGNGATINMTRAGVTVDGVAAAFFMYGSDNILIENFIINNSATDGIIITGDNTRSGPSSNVTVKNVVVNNSRRNGMSIISVKGMQVLGGSYNTSNGAAAGPWAGIDIEPNANCFLENVVLLGVNTSGNAGAGIQFTPGALDGSAGNKFQVNVSGGRSYHDGTHNDYISALWFISGSGANKIYGDINIHDFTVDNPVASGVRFYNWDADKSPRVLLDGVKVYNPDHSSGAASNNDRAGFVISAETRQAATTLGNIIMRNCHAEDTRVSARMSFGMMLATQPGRTLKNIRIEDPASINFASSSKTDVYVQASSVPNGMVNVDVVYSTPRASSNTK
jgi:hypothetical protein